MKNASLLKSQGLRPKKSFGQNFLEDKQVLARIAQRCRVTPESRVVVEIGAGLGALTASLLEDGAHVIAIERDRDLAPLLRARFQNNPEVEVHEANALTMDFNAFFEKHGLLTVCGNLPYHLTSPLIFRALDHVHTWRRLVVMVQKEVADRMAADEGSRTYGVLSVLLRSRLTVEKAFDVPPGAFHPPPKVWSSVVVMTPREKATEGSELPAFKRVVKALFAARRKTVRNGLKVLVDEAETHLRAAGIDPGARAETLDLDAFGRLAKVVQPLLTSPAPAEEDTPDEEADA